MLIRPKVALDYVSVGRFTSAHLCYHLPLLFTLLLLLSIMYLGVMAQTAMMCSIAVTVMAASSLMERSVGY